MNQQEALAKGIAWYWLKMKRVGANYNDVFVWNSGRPVQDGRFPVN